MTTTMQPPTVLDNRETRSRGIHTRESREARTRDSRTRLGTKDSYGRSIHGDRARSGSPSEFYRHQISRKDGLFSKVYDMNVFIHLGIEKFLDKQAVRDLLFEYDTDDIF